MLIEEWRVPTPGYPSRSALWMRFMCSECNVIFERPGGTLERTKLRHFCGLKCKYAWQVKSDAYHEAVALGTRKTWQTSEMRTLQSKRMREFYRQHPEKIPHVTGERHWAFGKILSWWKPWMIEDPSTSKWIRAVKRLFPRECSICAARKHLCVHHIVPISFNSELQYDINNGVVLCQWCHMGKDNPKNVHKLLRESPEAYELLMKDLLFKRSL